MHNLKEIRKDFNNFKKSLEKRSIEIDIPNLEKLDKKNRELIQKKESLEQEKKEISKSKDKSLFEKSKKLSQEIDEITEAQKKIKIELNSILSNIPNIPHKDVPIGKDENDNIEVTKSGTIPNFDFKVKSHYELGENLGMLDFELATKTTGSRFVFVRDKLALLERALSNFMLDTHVTKNGYSEISPPLLASESTMYGTGQLPKFENDQFEVKIEEGNERKFLIPTAEVILTNIVKDKIINQKDLPMRFVASTPCFRKEAGSYGKDTKGMIRQHQFYKVELVSLTSESQSKDEHERMLSCAEEVLKRLNLHYRVVILSSEDMGFAAQKTYDIEVWLPGQKAYREISSCSNCGDFQARRMNSRYKEGKETKFLHTLNGSGLAVGRTLISILENYQNEDGTIQVPDALIPYMGGINQISN